MSTSLTLPKIPSLADLGLSVNQIRGVQHRDFNKVSDGKKKVSYTPVKSRNVRPYQSNEEKKYPQLKIAPHAEIISEQIEKLPVLVIDAPTGTGKTLYLPYIMTKKGYKVRVAIPTTVGVRDAFKFQRNNSDLRVGYAAGREIHYTDDDQLVYATTGHFTERILGLIRTNKRHIISNVLGDILFIDEVHTATSQMTLLVGLIKYLYEQGGPKIVFTTATFNQGDIIKHFNNIPIYKIDLFSYPIEDIFSLEKRSPLKDDPNEEIARIINLELERWKTSQKKYHGIVFRPGINEVESTIDYLENKFSSDLPIEFYPAYSSLSPTEIEEIFHKTSNMKIIVGTNIIESSVTIEDIGFIIDDLLEKIAETSSTGGNRLTLTLLSKAGSQQRRGRTGRTMEGRAYKLISREDFDRLPPFRIKEIDRIPIYNIVLQLLDVGLNPIDILYIDIARYDQARRLLIEYGMIENRADRYFVTEIGKFVSSIPLGIQNAYMVYLAYNRFMERSPTALAVESILLRSVLATASMIESFGPNYFYVPRRNRNESHSEYIIRRDTHIEKFHEKYRGKTDIHTFVNLFWEMLSDIDIAKKYDRSTQHRFVDYIKEWSNNNSMNHKKIKEYLRVMRDIESIIESKINTNDLRSNLPNSGQAEILPRGRLGQYAFSLGRDLPDGGYDNIGNVVAIIFSKAYNINLFIKDKDNKNNLVYVDKKTGIQYKINRKMSFNQIDYNDKEGPTEIVAAETVEVVGKNGGRVYLASILINQDYIQK